MKVRFWTYHHGSSPKHGPQSWPWWRLMSFLVVRLKVQPPSTAYRLWVYVRGDACYLDIFFDRRNLTLAPNSVEDSPR